MSQKEHNWEAHVKGLDSKIQNLLGQIRKVEAENKILLAKLEKTESERDALQLALAPLSDEQLRFELKVALKRAERYSVKLESLQRNFSETSNRSQRKVSELKALLWRMVNLCKTHKIAHAHSCSSKRGLSCDCFFRMAEHYAQEPSSIRRERERQMEG